MIRVRFFSTFCSSETCMQIYESLYPDISSPVQYTFDENYTHAVIINTAMPNLKIPKQKCIGIAFEPLVYLKISQQFIDYAKAHISIYYIGNSSGLPLPFTNHYSFLWHVPIPKTIAIKDKLMSIIYSNKKETFGQQYRHILVEKILELNLPIDIWGKGCSTKTHRIKGEFSQSEPYESYQFTIAIENVQESHYVSEKLTNALFYETTPIYYGARCVDWKFPNQFIRLFGDISKDINLIMDILKNPGVHKKMIHSSKIAEKLNIRNHLGKILS